MTGNAVQGGVYVGDDDYNLLAVRGYSTNHGYQIILTPQGIKGWDLTEGRDIGICRWSQ